MIDDMTSSEPRHFDEPDKSCFAGYGCTDDCPVARGRQVPKSPFLHWRYVQPEPRSEAPLDPPAPLPVARLHVSLRERWEPIYLWVLKWALLGLVYTVFYAACYLVGQLLIHILTKVL